MGMYADVTFVTLHWWTACRTSVVTRPVEPVRLLGDKEHHLWPSVPEIGAKVSVTFRS